MAPSDESSRASAGGGAAVVHAERRDALEDLLEGVVRTLTEVMGMVVPEALGRGQRLRDCMKRFARHLKADNPWELETAAVLCSIGCASVPLSILRKSQNGAELNPAELAIVERLPKVASELISEIPTLQEVARIVLYQDKHFDGSGFPADGLAGQDIPLGSRILKIIDDRLDLEADGVVKERARRAMEERAGLYDPELLKQCFECFPGYLASAISGERKVLTLPVGALEPGQVVVSDITSHAGLTLVGSGNVLTTMMLERLRNFAEIGEVKEPVFVQEAAGAA